MDSYDSSWIGWSKDRSLRIVSGCSTEPTVAGLWYDLVAAFSPFLPLT